MTNVCLVNDKRHQLNWGCRATTIGLMSILQRHHSLSATTLHLAVPHPVGPLSTLVTEHDLGRTGLAWRALQSSRLRWLHRVAGGWSDFIARTPQESINRFSRHSSSDPRLTELLQLLEDCDEIVINGEGSFIFRNPRRRDLDFILMIIELASQFGKPVHFVNAMISRCPNTALDQQQSEVAASTLAKARTLLLRDRMSVQMADSLGIPSARFVPDALFTWRSIFPDLFTGELPQPPQLLDSHPEGLAFGIDLRRLPSDFIAIGGASRPPEVSTKTWLPYFEGLVQRLTQEKSVGVVLVDTGGDDFLEQVANQYELPFVRASSSVYAGAMILSRARLFITGRYHPSILASMGGTPTVYLESNSHKTLSIQEVLGVDSPHVHRINASALPSVLDAALGLLEHEAALRERLRKKTKELAEVAVDELSKLVG